MILGASSYQKLSEWWGQYFGTDNFGMSYNDDYTCVDDAVPGMLLHWSSNTLSKLLLWLYSR